MVFRHGHQATARAAQFEPKHAGSHAKPDGIRRLDAAAGPEPLPLRAPSGLVLARVVGFVSAMGAGRDCLPFGHMDPLMAMGATEVARFLCLLPSMSGHGHPTTSKTRLPSRLAEGPLRSERASESRSGSNSRVRRYAVILVDSPPVALVGPVRQRARRIARGAFEPAAVEIDHVPALARVVGQHLPWQRVIALADA